MSLSRLRFPLVTAFLTLAVLLLGWTGAAHASGDGLVDEYRAVYGTPGVAAAVVDGKAVETIVRGRDGDGNAVTARTRFRIASMSKSMTAAAIMVLVDRGRVSLDDPVVKLLPDFKLADARFAGITVRHLLSHTSGLSGSTNNEYVFPPPRTAQEVVATLADKRLAADPGTRWEYHNTNYSIAARIVEVVSGKPFDAFLQAEVFTPLGMTGTSSTLGCSDEADGLPYAYEVVLGVAVAVPEMPGTCVGNGGVISTLDDMVRWLRFNQGTSGSDLLSAASLAQMHTPQPQAEGYGLGWQSRPGAPTPVIRHGGTLATWTGDMVFSPKAGIAAVVLTNSGGDPGLLAANLLAERIGAATTPMSNALTLVNVILLGLTVVIAVLLVTAIVRARRWAVRRRAARRPWLVLRLVPLTLVTVAGAVVPALIWGAFDLQYWIVTLWLLPLLALFGLVCFVLGAVALVRSLWFFRRVADV
ncbi:serine hydrolase domain-containing protein [Nonomuraea sp. NPDC050310]|uniref:serine hydrolase domain-containing protein n=1 Tax=Nonomuraea sp. NPDC050310 TaxID=3154935 RepID=UPI0033E51CFC